MHTDGIWFKDEALRTLILRGVNLSGSSKVPMTPDGATHLKENLLDSRNVSFVGRPFPLEEADEHFGRLKAWGFTFIRLLVTWEAIEHKGPGEYDGEYLDYLEKIVSEAERYGITLFIDPHQDVWSRWTGGDGAPGWTMELLGMDLMKMEESGGGLVHGLHEGKYPMMQWPANGSRYGAATMFTLFFGGKVFAPKTMMEGRPVQEFLQEHYINAIRQVALRLKKYPNLVGYDSLNEPMPGMIGVEDISKVDRSSLTFGVVPSFYQSMLAVSGFPQEVHEYTPGFGKANIKRTLTINPNGVKLYKEGFDCVFRQNGVWEVKKGKPELLKKDHFGRLNGEKVHFERDYLKPFIVKYMKAVREVEPKTIVFIEGITMNSKLEWNKDDGDAIVHAGHWYDGLSLFLKTYFPWFTFDIFAGKPSIGRGSVRKSFAAQLAAVARDSEKRMVNIPVLIGEFGLPMDLNRKKTYKTGNFKIQDLALDNYYNAMDESRLSCTIWNYTPDNSNQWGDLWNDEDLSIFSRDQRKNRSDINSGGRGLNGFVRPYARAVAGIPYTMLFDPRKKTFLLEFTHEPAATAPTEIFLPALHYPKGFTVTLSDGQWEQAKEDQVILYHHTDTRTVHTVLIKPAKGKTGQPGD